MLIIIQFEEEISLSQKSTGNFRKNLCWEVKSNTCIITIILLIIKIWRKGDQRRAPEIQIAITTSIQLRYGIFMHKICIHYADYVSWHQNASSMDVQHF
jgi:hypothetical protein